jgi:hypothetical protein
VTLTIKGREPFIWPTWFDEVAATTRDGQLNARWRKAPRQMFIKCSVVNAIRMSLLADFTLPYTVEEMDQEPVIPGYRSITQTQLDAHEGEATLGEVTATTHQVDMTPFRKAYFKALSERGLFQGGEDQERRDWQFEVTGKESITEWDVNDYSTMMDVVQEYPKIDPDPPANDAVPVTKDGTPVDEAVKMAVDDMRGEAIEKQINEKLDKLEATQGDAGDAGKGSIQKDEGTERIELALQYTQAVKGIFQTDVQLSEWEKSVVGSVFCETWTVEQLKKAIKQLPKKGKPEPDVDYPNNLTDKTYQDIKIALLNFPDVAYMTIRSRTFKEHAFEIIGEPYRSLTEISEAQGQQILDALAKEKAEILAAKESGAINPEEGGGDPAPMTATQFDEMKRLVIDMNENVYHKTVGSQGFRDLVFHVIKRKFKYIKQDLTQTEADDVLLAMQDIIDEESNNAAFTEMNVGE